LDKEFIFLNFKAFLFDPKVTAGIAAAGFSTPTPIQTQAIPRILQGRDLMGLAQTGTGKTAAFVLPILQRLLNGKRGLTRALVIVPTRELADQIHQAFGLLGGRTGLRSATVYGGVGFQPQVTALRNADIAVACPGRLLDHIGRRTVDLSHLEVLVLDEADQMFDMGFLPDIRKILTHLPALRQNLMFSATMPAQIQGLAGEILKKPVRVQVAQEAPAATVSHALYPVARHLKTALLLKLLGSMRAEAVLVFTRTKHRARQLAAKLGKAGLASASLQGNLSQAQRRDAMNGFKSGKYSVLVATDIAARGIDVSNISHVINFDMPATPEIYIHRIGRTGRAERCGEAFNLITEEDRAIVAAIQRSMDTPAEERTLPDFNYLAPVAGAKTPHTPRNVKKRNRRRSGGNQTPRDGRGAFAWLAPRNAKASAVPSS
jgi:superfamily II DNA/RNA helicase